jgi:hypothetical protein
MGSFCLHFLGRLLGAMLNILDSFSVTFVLDIPSSRMQVFCSLLKATSFPNRVLALKSIRASQLFFHSRMLVLPVDVSVHG